MASIDFRDFKVKEVEEILKQHKFNNDKIKNFKKEFIRQKIDNLGALKNVRDSIKLSQILPFKVLKIVDIKKDKEGNEKFIFLTYDNFFVESLLMKSKKDISVCVSTQIGCRFSCKICNTGKIGFYRNLYPHEIIEQIKEIYLNSVYPERIRCVSFMGMGEPFDNLDFCMHALEWISSDWTFKISRKKITFSTSGCVDFKNFFSYEKLPNLAISLHSAIESKRREIMPNAKIPLSVLKEYMIEYVKRTKKQISIEYCLIENFNDSKDDIFALINYLHDIPCKVNLLNYNPIVSNKYKKVSENKIFEVIKLLEEAKIPALYRKSFGSEINAACGQLGESYLKNRSIS